MNSQTQSRQGLSLPKCGRLCWIPLRVDHLYVFSTFGDVKQTLTSLYQASRVVPSEPTSSLPAVGGPLLAILGSYPLSRLSSSIMSSSAVGPAGPTSLVSRRTYSLGFILVVGLIAFLFGSLLRSLLAPADYIIYDQRETIAGGGGDQVERALVRAFDASSRNLREARRLLETPLWFGGYDIILVKRS